MNKKFIIKISNQKTNLSNTKLKIVVLLYTGWQINMVKQLNSAIPDEKTQFIWILKLFHIKNVRVRVV